MGSPRRNRILEERPLPQDGRERKCAAARRRPVRSVTVNTLESPLGWLFVRGKVTRRQYEAGEMLRNDYERAQLEPSTTMSWNAEPIGRVKRGPPCGLDPTTAQIAAKQRFDAALEAVGPGLGDIAWRVICAGEGMRDAERALGWPVRAGKLVLGLALDRLAAFYRL